MKNLINQIYASKACSNNKKKNAKFKQELHETEINTFLERFTNIFIDETSNSCLIVNLKLFCYLTPKIVFYSHINQNTTNYKNQSYRALHPSNKFRN